MTNLHNFNYKTSFIDQESGSQIVLSPLHAHVHRGTAFSYTQSIASLADDGFLYFEMITPLNDNLHLKDMGIWISEGPISIDIIERPTLTTGTTAVIPKNMNRTRVNGVPLKSGTILKTNPTGISAGESIIGDPVLFGVAGLGAQTSPGNIGTQNERVLEKGENTYLLAIQNLSGETITITSNIVWYE